MVSVAYGQEADLASAIPERQQRVDSRQQKPRFGGFFASGVPRITSHRFSHFHKFRNLIEVHVETVLAGFGVHQFDLPPAPGMVRENRCR